MSLRAVLIPTISVFVLLATGVPSPAGEDGSAGARGRDSARPGRSSDDRQGVDRRSSIQRELALLESMPDGPKGQLGVVPQPGRDPVSGPNRLGLQHADAIRNSVSSVPIGDDIRGREPDWKPRAGRDGEGAARLATYPMSPYYAGPVQRIGPGLSLRYGGYGNYPGLGGGDPGYYAYTRPYIPYEYDDNYVDDMFRFGFVKGPYHARFYDEALTREDSLLAHFGEHLDRGLELFRKGRYHEAASAFKLAADTHHGDPASRLYAAHALFAIGRYKEAVEFLRRAFELQPKIAMLTYDIRDDYGNTGDFERQVEAIEKALLRSPKSFERLVVLGYVRYYTAQRDEAFVLLNRADKLYPKDALVGKLIENCRPPDVAFDPVQK